MGGYRRLHVKQLPWAGLQITSQTSTKELNQNEREKNSILKSILVSEMQLLNKQMNKQKNMTGQWTVWFRQNEHPGEKLNSKLKTSDDTLSAT